MSNITVMNNSNNMDESEDLLLSYLNEDCLDTSSTFEYTSSPSLSSTSTISLDDPTSPLSSSPSSSTWSIPFLMEAHHVLLSKACMDTNLMASISPFSISGNRSSEGQSVVTPSASCTLEIQSPPPPRLIPHLLESLKPQQILSHQVSNGNHEPSVKRNKRERKRQNGNRRVVGPSSALLSPNTVSIQPCKPILPASPIPTTGTTALPSLTDPSSKISSSPSSSSSSSPSPPSSPRIFHIKSEPLSSTEELQLSSLLSVPAAPDNNNTYNNHDNKINIKKEIDQPITTATIIKAEKEEDDIKQDLSNTANNTKRQKAMTPMDAQSKRQERLIKNRAAALLSRKRKREYLMNLEQERQYLTDENVLLKSKMELLEKKLLQVEKEHQQFKHQHTHCTTSLSAATHHSSSLQQIDPLYKLINAFIIIFISFILMMLSLRVNKLTENDKKDSTLLNCLNSTNESSPLTTSTMEHILDINSEAKNDNAMKKDGIQTYNQLLGKRKRQLLSSAL
ncbi:hypothetical protein BJ944DRAFT_242282 [Cunninghamella echinulata]|nr:hypothetical protein BJ944DRAFT_242282 [Cunninghamella echinulata]